MIHFADTKEKREVIKRLLALRKEQKELFMKNLIKPINDNIKIIEGVLKRQESIERLAYHSEALGKHIKGLLRDDYE